MAALYLLAPRLLVSIFASEHDSTQFAAMADLVPRLLMCVAAYSLADAVNVSFAFALRGAGDTRFVTLITFLLAWPVMVIPLISLYKPAVACIGMAVRHGPHFLHGYLFWFRFRSGKWKTMRVIEPALDVA